MITAFIIGFSAGVLVGFIILAAVVSIANKINQDD